MTKHGLYTAITELDKNELSILTLSDEQASSLLKNIHASLKATDYYYISKDSGLLPFLSIEDNLFIGVTKKEQVTFQKQLIKWTTLFKLTAQLTNTSPNNLSEDMLLLIHLIRALSLDRQLILINALSLDDSLPFIQSLIPSLHRAAAEKGIRIVLIKNQSQGL